MNLKEYIEFDANLPNIQFDKIIDETTPKGIDEYYQELSNAYIEWKKNPREYNDEDNNFSKNCEIICKVTNYCNKNCSYCFDINNRKKPRVVLNKDYIMKMMRLLVQEKFTDIDWIWHGGECLSVDKKWMDDICFEMAKYAIDKHINLHFSVQTNGTLLDDEWFEIIDKYNMDLGTSYDWSAQNQRGYCLSKQLISDRFSFVISVITNKNVKNLINDYEEAKRIGVPFSYNFAFGTKDTRDVSEYLNVSEVISEYKKYFDYVLYDDNPRITERSILGFVGRTIDREADVCNLGNCLKSFRICINSDGTLWKCDVTSIKELYICTIDEIENLGQYFGHENIEKLKALKRKQVDNYCKDCELLPVCGQGCLHCTLTESNGEMPYQYFCTFYKEILPYIYEKIGNLTPEEFVNINPSIKQYLIQHRYLPAYKKEELKKLWKL